MLISTDSRTRCWVTFALALLTLPVAAQEAATPEQAQELCSTLGETASQILLLRDSGMPLSRVLELTETTEPGMAKLARAMAMAAYDLPRFSTPKMKLKQSQDFRNEVELMCFKANSN